MQWMGKFTAEHFNDLSGQLDFCLANISTHRREEPIFTDEFHVIQYFVNAYITSFVSGPV